METIGYIASAFIGISLGLIGGGGSILTVPVLVYLFGLNPLLSTSYSLFIVGSTSLVGAFSNIQKGFVSYNTAFFFGISSITTVFITRMFILPAIPENILSISGFTVTEPMLTMLLFAILMLTASASMIRNSENKKGKHIQRKANLSKLLLNGVVIGLVTGLLGAGGGFLLIPTLVLFVGITMKEAVGTSLLIIALNSLIGFTGDLGHLSIDWLFLAKITGIAMGGIFIGSFLNEKVDGGKLKKGFGWFILLMGIYIIIKEVSLL